MAAAVIGTGRPTWFQNLPPGGAWSPGGATYLVPKLATRGRMVTRLVPKLAARGRMVTRWRHLLDTKTCH